MPTLRLRVLDPNLYIGLGLWAVRREVLYNILIEFGVPLKLVRLIKMCLNETYGKVRVGILSRMV
jgi:hypothetical protein